LVGPDGKRLVEIWNGLPGVQPVAKFTHRKIASERIGKVLLEFEERRGARTEIQPIPESTPPQSPGESAARAVADRPAGPPPLLVAPRCPRGATGAPCCARQGKAGRPLPRRRPRPPRSPQRQKA
jgi:hypothetical protein